ncbi:hypothetical protein ACN2MM_09505 [Alkalilimnicola ehrlichii MLHE-1]|uniref:Uncharacterized protein n=1 Tax=Alkalilimnicola ehrlichii (strain ATCC BAA-1101 / DSM 17681 / MLHE-1) TaxID=187272 RepID=Q0A7T9_ALKEH|nr:hypothetical protein [Alkalilimnicola ehrlichii]ABI57098.1 hypothetical protein Mlg_1752 [Alkalilimnicola ehrlichii MLHE-1]
MIDIHHLRLQLPEGYAGRAPHIVRLLGRALADAPTAGSADLARLQVGPVTLPAGASDRQAADCIARAIRAQLPGAV